MPGLILFYSHTERASRIRVCEIDRHVPTLANFSAAEQQANSNRLEVSRHIILKHTAIKHTGLGLIGSWVYIGHA